MENSGEKITFRLYWEQGFICNGNGFRVVNLAMSGHLIVRSKFPSSKIHLR
jgi:hypothetical protein